uniref:Uncharacterized protein n=1 Tax=Salarias fasciatus TaxID=181472 RepID=A0A672IVN8_SALFA
MLPSGRSVSHSCRGGGRGAESVTKPSRSPGEPSEWSPDLDGAVLGAGREAVPPVGEGQVQHLVAVLPQRLHLHAGDAVEQPLELPVPRHARDAVVAVEQLPPQELISGHGQPLPAGQPGAQHGAVRQVQEDLQQQAVRQNWATLHPDILGGGGARRSTDSRT